MEISTMIPQDDELVHPVKRGLTLIWNPLDQYCLIRKEVLRRADVGTMMESSSIVLERCNLFQNAVYKFHPLETKDLSPVIKELEQCRGMPIETKEEKKAMVLKADECLYRLHSEIEKALRPT
jgi:hypothetical protein